MKLDGGEDDITKSPYVVISSDDIPDLANVTINNRTQTNPRMVR
jgi:hypothetical protein